MNRMRPQVVRIGLFFAALAVVAYPRVSSGEPNSPEAVYDVVVKNGRIVDGSGAPWYYGDVAIEAGRIAAIGRFEESQARRTIDAAGLVVAPGFVDMMGQTASPMLDDPASAMNLLTQGITTINAGEGGSAAPLDESAAKEQGWQTMAEYFTKLDAQGLPINVAQTVGHTQVRRIVLGDVDRRPTESELGRMQDLVREAMQAGAIGVSTALIYPPAVYADTEEIAALASIAGEYGGRYYTHMRNEGDQLLEAIDEALEIGEKAGTPVHIFHLKAAGRQNWGKMELAIARIKSARAGGRQVTADIYPYINNGLGIVAFIHPRHFADGYERLRNRLDDGGLRAEIRREMETGEGWENWYRHVGHDWSRVVIGSTSHPRYADHAGKSLAEMAKAVGEDPWETFFALCRAGAFALPQSMSEANKMRAMGEEFVSFCTDVGPAGGTRIASHPRAFGAFPRLLSRYVRDYGVISLERAVAQSSAVACNEILAYDRGRIAVGQAADVIVFDYETLTDRATLADPGLPSEGMRYVLVNGEVVLEDGTYTGKRPGRVLRGPGYRGAAEARVTTGQGDPRLQSFDALMQEFMREHEIPGAALAVTKDGRLVYARGYGYADKEAGVPVEPTHLFRIASISKPVTAAAILHLVEQGKLTLDSRVFDILPFEPFLEPGQEADPRQREITIRQLLQHTGGWDRDASFDAMFQSVRFAKTLGVDPPAGPAEVIRVMSGLPLDFDPGTKYAYSNYGYCLLGRVIEKLSGQAYDEYVRGEILAPLGIKSMRLGKTRSDGRGADEVKYYDSRTGTSVFAEDLGKPVPQPYGAWYLEAMDAHGGWLASAVDLARFAVAFDDTDACRILKGPSIQKMFACPEGTPGHKSNGEPKDSYYACGWMVREVQSGDGEAGINTWHTGSLPGTATILVRRHDGINWVVLFNTRNGRNTTHLTRSIDPLLHRAADAVTEWPQEDRFGEYVE